MKISLAISLLVHLVIFAFLNIYKYEKSSDELISSVSVISQNYYDALISKKPDINHSLIQKQPDILKLEGELGERELVEHIDKLKNKLKKFRSAGLEKGGEYSYENLTFKFLRRNGYIKKLFELKNRLLDTSLTL